MSTLVTIVHVSVCLFLMLTVLLQSGKGGGMGSAFGGGTTTTVFGGSGAGGFLRKLTATAAALFMITSMALAYIASQSGSNMLERFSQSERARAKQREMLNESLRQEALQNAETEDTGVTVPQDGETTPDDVNMDMPDEGTTEPASTEPSAGAAPAGGRVIQDRPADAPAAPAAGTAAPPAAPAAGTAAPPAAPAAGTAAPPTAPAPAQGTP